MRIIDNTYYKYYNMFYRMIANNTIHVKLSNIELIRTALLEGEDTKIGLSQRTGLSVATCATIINAMLEAGEVLPSSDVNATGGRPAHVYRYNPHYAHILGLYVSNEAGRNLILCATSTAIGDTLFRKSFLPAAITYEAIESTLAKVVEQDPLIKAIGIGIPGITHEGVVGACDIPALQGIAAAEKIQDRFGLSTVVENDMNLTAYGYFKKHASELDSLVAVSLPKGNGPGTGIILDGKILRGHSGFAGEVHYLPDNFNTLFQSPRDRGAFLQALSKMLATIVALINPQRILLTGGLCDAGMMESLHRMCLEIIPAEHCPELLFQEDCSGEYLEGLRLKAQERLRYRYRLISN
jgi:predicted NBD/HSP70 family sugar kinase